MVVLTYESKEKIERYEELWSKTRTLLRLITKSSGDYDQKYMKTFYPQTLLDECLYKL